MPKTLLILLLAVGAYAAPITIAVAANVSYAMNELATAFKKNHPDIPVRVTLGSSGKLTAQIKNGAPYGLFMAANIKFPEALYQSGHAITKPVVYARGTLACLSAGPQAWEKGIKLLEENTISRIAIANPKTAPYGAAAMEAMTQSGVFAHVKSKLVYAETISQAVTYALSAADIGFIATSSLYSPKMAKYKQNVNWVSVDPSLYTPIEQGIVLLKHDEKNPGYKAFYDFMLGQTGQSILLRYGYILP